MQDSSFCVSRTCLLAGRFFLSCVSCVDWSEVGEATGIFFVLRWDEESRVFKLIVAKFLKGDGCCDRREDGDVCEGTEEDNVFGCRRSLEARP